MGDALAELAVNLGILGDALEATVERWNAMVEAGHDDDYGPGDNYYDSYWGDPAHKGKKEATLGKFEGGPYHAAEVRSGALGTKGGPQTDTMVRVLVLDLKPIDGLYAAGNVMGSMMGMTYGGGGARWGREWCSAVLPASMPPSATRPPRHRNSPERASLTLDDQIRAWTMSSSSSWKR